MVQILICNFGLSVLIVLLVLFVLVAGLFHELRLDLLRDLELPSLLVHDELLARKDYTFVWFYAVIVEDFLSQL